jgi:isopenicillin N synthase-like dioxygenase
VRDVPVIDVSTLDERDGRRRVAAEIDAACRHIGFFSVVGHGVPADLLDQLETLAHQFFDLDDDEKARIGMARGGRAWRGWFPVGGELTSGRADQKEGLYFGQELAPDDPRVLAGTPLHGPNLFPARPAGLRDAVLTYMEAVSGLGRRLLRGMSLGLGLDPFWFDHHLTADPLVLFRIFRYPPMLADDDRWGVGEHTDYGLITILAQDAMGGLEVRGRDGWISVPARPDALVVNLGDMLERMTGGAYRSTPHRVRNTSGRDRLTFPLFFDPSWDAEVLPIPSSPRASADDATDRWDGRSVHEWSGTYGDYLLTKVGRVFPDLRDEVL